MKASFETGVRPVKGSEKADLNVEDTANSSTEGDIESIADWRSLKEQAMPTAISLVEGRVDKKFAEMKVFERAAAAATLLDDPDIRGDLRGDNSKRFLVESLSSILKEAEDELGSVIRRPHETAGIPT